MSPDKAFVFCSAIFDAGRGPPDSVHDVSTLRVMVQGAGKEQGRAWSLVSSFARCKIRQFLKLVCSCSGTHP